MQLWRGRVRIWTKWSSFRITLQTTASLFCTGQADTCRLMTASWEGAPLLSVPKPNVNMTSRIPVLWCPWLGKFPPLEWGWGQQKSEVLSPLGLDYSSVDWVNQKGNDHSAAWPPNEGSSVKKGKSWKDSLVLAGRCCAQECTASRQRTLMWRGHWASGGEGVSASWYPDYILSSGLS